MFPTPIEKSSPGIQTTYKVFLPIALFIWLLPLLAIFMTSVRSAGDINAGNVFGWPTSFQMLQNYVAVFTESEATTYFLNSLKITIPTVILSVAMACLAGYALAIYRFKAALPLFFIFVAGNFVPFQILMVPVRQLSVETGLYNTVTGLVLPLVRPAIAALAVLIFTFIWNDYFWATVLTNGEASKPITAAMKALNGQFVSRWHLVSAASLLAAVPPVVMFFLMQKHFIAGLTLGATKG